MYERFSLMLGRMLTVSLDDLKRQEGQGTTEYAMVIGFVVVTLTITLGLLGKGITDFLGRVALKLDALVP
jgi:Flp pilus assembly pilin Flp